MAIIAAVAAAVGLIAINSFSVSSVQAIQGGGSGVQKWEYCAITSASYSGGNFGARGTAVIRYFQVGGVKEETIEFVPDIGQNIGQRTDLPQPRPNTQRGGYRIRPFSFHIPAIAI